MLISNIFKKTYTLGENTVFQKCLDFDVQLQTHPDEIKRVEECHIHQSGASFLIYNYFLLLYHVLLALQMLSLVNALTGRPYVMWNVPNGFFFFFSTLHSTNISKEH